MKLYKGEPINTTTMRESERNRLRETTTQDIVIGRQPTRMNSLLRETEVLNKKYKDLDQQKKQTIWNELKQVERNWQNSPEKFLHDIIQNFLTDQKWLEYQSETYEQDWEQFFMLLERGVESIRKYVAQKDEAQDVIVQKLTNVSEQNKVLEQDIINLKKIKSDTDVIFYENQQLQQTIDVLQEKMQDKYELEQQLGHQDEVIVQNNNEIQRFKDKLYELQTENNHLQQNCLELSEDVEALQFTLREDSQTQDENQKGISADKAKKFVDRLKKLGVFVEDEMSFEGTRQRLNTRTKNEFISKMNQRIKESDKLKKDDEEKYLSVIESMITSNIDSKQRDALLAIRKELLRKQIAIDRKNKGLREAEKHITKKETEMEQLTDMLLKKDEFAKQYKRIIDKLRRDNIAAINNNNILQLENHRLTTAKSIVSKQSIQDVGVVGRNDSVIDYSNFFEDDQSRTTMKK